MGRDDRERIETWSAIGAFIGRDARTAQRYERELGLPVRRLPGSRSTVFAYASELDAWRTGGMPALSPGSKPLPEIPAPPPSSPAPRAERRSSAWPWAAAVLGAAVLLGAGALVWPRGAGANGSTPVVVAALQNDTGDAVFDRVIPRLVQIDLTQSPLLQVAGEAKVARALTLMERPRDAVLTSTLAREVCVRGDGGALVVPAVALLGDHYVLTLVATDCVSGRSLAQEREVVAAKGEAPRALDRMASRLRRRLGESRASIARLDVPSAPVRTASFDALRAYSEAAWLLDHGKDVEAVPLFRRAIELDAGFGLAWLGLAQTYFHARQWREDAEAMTHAYALRGSMSERDHLFTAFRYHQVVEKDLVAALASLKALAAIYPHDSGVLTSLSALHFELGAYGDAIAAAEQALKAEPHSPVPRTRLMLALIRSGRASAARAVGDRAVEEGVVDSRLNEMRILAAGEAGDLAAAERLLQAAVGTPGERDALLQYASVAFGAGQAARFDAAAERADLLGRRQGVRMDWSAVSAALADMGAADRARRRLAMVEPDLRSGRYLRAVALVGDPAQAQAELVRDEGRAPKDTLRNAEYGPEARAILALRRGDATAAVRAVSAPDPYEWRTLEFPYIRAEALLAAGDGAGAAAGFRAVLAHPGWSNWPQYGLSHLGLARALRLQHDLAGARREYDAFLQVWRKADPDLPQVREARIALLQLQTTG